MPNFKITTGDTDKHRNTISPRFKFDWRVDISLDRIKEKIADNVFVQKITRTTVKVEVEEIWGLCDVMYAPGRRTYSAIDITFVELEEDSEYHNLLKVFQEIHGGGNNKNTVPMEYAKKMTITTTHIGTNNRSKKYIYKNCFIYEIKADEFSYEENGLLKFTISIRFDNYDVE